jgi:hypothetical protein
MCRATVSFSRNLLHAVIVVGALALAQKQHYAAGGPKDRRSFWSSYNITAENKIILRTPILEFRLQKNNNYEYFFTKFKIFISSPNVFCSVSPIPHIAPICSTARASLPHRYSRFGETWAMALKYAVALPPERTSRLGASGAECLECCDCFNVMCWATFQKLRPVYNKACHFSAPQTSNPTEQVVQWRRLDVVLSQLTQDKYLWKFNTANNKNRHWKRSWSSSIFVWFPQHISLNVITLLNFGLRNCRFKRRFHIKSCIK